ELRGQRTGAASDVEDPAVGRESGEIGEGHRQRPRVAAHEPVIGIGIAQAHFFSFGGNARAKATLCIAQGSSARFVETDSASTRSQPFISRPRLSNAPASGYARDAPRSPPWSSGSSGHPRR